MHSRGSTYALTFLLMASGAASGCDSGDIADASLTGPSTTGRFVAILTVGPAILAAGSPGFTSCHTGAPFDVMVNVNVRARQDLFIRRVGFEFVDPSNHRVLPIPFPVTTEVKSSVLLPVPTTHPIPFPGEASMSNALVPAGGTLTAPFRLQFDCGVAARGTLFASVDTADADGSVLVVRTSAQIGG